MNDCRWRLLAWMVLVLAASCRARNDLKMAAVTGKISFEGKPVEGAVVMFLPQNGPVASAKTDAAGQFRLATIRVDDGAVVGAHQVTIVKHAAGEASPQEPYPAGRNVLPPRYADPATSGLTALVQASAKNHFVWELTP